MSWRTLIGLTVLAAFLPSILSVAFPPISNDPAIRIQLMQEAFEKVSEYIENGWTSLKHFKSPVELPVDGSTFIGTIEAMNTPVVKVESIENTKEEYSYEGLESHFQTEIDAIAKAYWHDEEFGTDQNIGGLRVILTDMSQTLELSNDRNNLTVTYTDATLIAEAFIGADEGKLRLSRVVVATDGDVQVKSIEQPLLVREEEKLRFQEAICDQVLQEIQKSFEEYIRKHHFILGTHVFNKILFDFRLTDHPIFGENTIDVSFVGRWLYDDLNQYTFKTIFGMDESLRLAKIFLQEDEYKLESQIYEEVFNVYDNQELTNTTALASEGSEADENERKAKGGIRLYVKEDFFNTFFDVIIRAGITEYKIPKQLLNYLESDEGLALKLEDPIEDISLTYRLDKFAHSFYPGGLKHDIRTKIKYNGHNAVYDTQNQINVLFRNGKFAYDVVKFKTTKKADKNYPRLLTTENIKKYFDLTLNAFKKELFSDSKQTPITEFRFEDKYFVLAVTSNV